ncbi:putative sporulation transcription regulator WhiA [Alicyclobacillus acidoterrestris]|uniref:DNA-binding protein WhiA n=1 Tax=Alicyclobacillus suci TaxID=2816080 RepID=UPI0011916C76|nr:DNA-binding protein WhiA [Alicyclobacillus suci]GEO26155.1 putative sporulation transcription regulator WhiA [Alicyclobacillus acidoterrestris]
MSFAAETKKELTQIEQDACCAKSELQAILGLGGCFVTVDGRRQLVVETENVATARRIYTVLKETFGTRCEVIVRKKMRLKKNNVYAIRLTALQAEVVLSELGWTGETEDGPLAANWPKPDADCCNRAFLRGCFLAGGSVNAPGSPSYHLEIYAASANMAETVLALMNDYELHARLTTRKKGYIVYLKEGEKIVDFLNLIGAVRALLKFEDTRILKGMRNQVNRLVNCETANMNKTIAAAVRQLENIQLIEAHIGLQQLPDSLRVAAELRLRYPEANLQELCRRMGNRVSKSGLNHRFRKMEEIAERLRSSPTT